MHIYIISIFYCNPFSGMYILEVMLTSRTNTPPRTHIEILTYLSFFRSFFSLFFSLAELAFMGGIVSQNYFFHFRENFLFFLLLEIGKKKRLL